MFWDIFLAVLFLIIGFIMLSKGADWFVDGAAGLAEKLRIPTLVIGLTIVSFGTTAPELSTSIISALQGNVGVAVGNALGSNLCNILLILGLSAVLAPVPAKKESRTLAIPVLLIASVLVILFGSLNDQIDRWEGIFLLVFMIAYTTFLIVNAFKNRPTEEDLPLETPEFTPELDEEENLKGFDGWRQKMKKYTWFLVVSTLVGLVVVVGGAMLAVEGATTIAEALQINQKIIGLTVVAIGTSLPELITSTTAARKGETDIAIGNIVGACTINLLLVLGASSTITPLPFSSQGVSFMTDGFIALAAAGLLALLCYLPSHTIKRWGGVVMLLGFVAYYVYLFIPILFA